jgi:hypothetical protein
VAFVLIAVFLGHSLVKIYQDRWITKTIKAALIDETSRLPATYLGKVFHYSEADKIHVMASVHTPAILTPTQVTNMQDRLSAQPGWPAELILHCVMSNNVSAQGSVNNVIIPKLDGTFVQSSENDTLNDIAAAEQIIREHLSNDRALLTSVYAHISIDGCVLWCIYPMTWLTNSNGVSVKSSFPLRR